MPPEIQITPVPCGNTWNTLSDIDTSGSQRHCEQCQHTVHNIFKTLPPIPGQDTQSRRVCVVFPDHDNLRKFPFHHFTHCASLLAIALVCLLVQSQVLTVWAESSPPAPSLSSQQGSGANEREAYQAKTLPACNSFLMTPMPAMMNSNPCIDENGQTTSVKDWFHHKPSR